MNNSAENLGYRIKILREQCGFTQSNLANHLKVDQSLISMAEKGKRAITADMLEKLAALFGVQVNAFYEPEIEIRPLVFALRASEIEVEDLDTISAINQIAINCRFMTKLIEGDYANEQS